MSNSITVALKQPETYKEFIAYASFETEPDEANRAIAINLDVTKQELDSLFSTRKYERPYQPEYYSPLDELIGELYTTKSESLALHVVTEKISQFMPSLVVDNNTSFTFEDHSIYMNLVFYYNYDFNKILYNYEKQFNVVT